MSDRRNIEVLPLGRDPSACLLVKALPEDGKVIGETFDHHVGPTGEGKRWMMNTTGPLR